MTGRHLPGTPNTIEARQTEVEAIQVSLSADKPKPSGTSSASTTTTTSTLPDDEIIQRAGEARNGDKFRRLWAGDTASYPSHSEADAALCSMLAYWCGGPDADRIDWIFRQSGLYREKWERADYRTRTIQGALAGRTEYYTPSSNGHAGSNGRPDDADEPAVNEAEDDPHRLARLFLDDHHTGDGSTLRFWASEIYRHDGAAYRSVPNEQLRAELSQRIKREFNRLNVKAIQKWEAAGQVDEKGKPQPRPVARKVTTRLVTDTLHALASMIVLPSAIAPPTWILQDADATPFPADEILACRNCLIHLPSFVSGAGGTQRHTPRFFSLNALDYNFERNRPPAERWINFLSELWPDDREAIDTLQEWFGYCLLPDTRQQKILMLVGPKRWGKGPSHASCALLSACRTLRRQHWQDSEQTSACGPCSVKHWRS